MHDAIIRLRARLARSCLTGLCLGLYCFADCFASVDVCQEPPTYSHLSVGYYNHEKSSIGNTLTETNPENYDFDLLFKSSKWVFGAGNRYTKLNENGLQTNGHLHTFFLPVHRLSQNDRRSFRASIAPALSATSNVVRRTGEYTADAFQFLAALVWGRQLSDRLDLRYGICGDHRFGSYRIYPVIAVDWRPHPDWTVELGFPTSQLSYRVLTGLTSLLRIAPDGNEWYVKDNDLEKQSQLVYEAYTIEWAFNWQAHKDLLLTASVGRQFHIRYEATLLDGSRVRRSSDSGTRVGVALSWRF